MDGVIVGERWIIIAVFFVTLLGFTGIGVLSILRKRTSTSDYLLAGRSVSPWLVALSAVATMNSGFMFVGMIGFTFREGISSIWMLVGWTLGDFLAWRFLYRKLRETSEARDSISVIALLRPRNSPEKRLLVVVAAWLTVFYLSMYAAAQLKAGSTALHLLFGMPEKLGAILGAGIVVIYCFSGGIRASIWTDAAQSFVMFGSMFAMVVIAAIEIGGPWSLATRLEGIDSTLVNVIPRNARFGFFLYLLGMVCGGFGVVGQPHILVRSLCIQDPSQIRRARVFYFLWLIPFYLMAVGVGLHARVLIPELQNSEFALPALSLFLLPSVFVGLILAGLFAATMSTADSQIIACTTAVTQDIQPRWQQSYTVSKITTLAVTVLALTIALTSPDRVFDLVLDAWAVLSCSLGPLLIINVFGWPCSQRMAMAMLATGFVASNLWAGSTFEDGSAFSDHLYVNLPGMAAVFLLYLSMLAIRRTRSPSTRDD